MVPAMTCFHGFLRQLPWDDIYVGNGPKLSEETAIFLVSFKVFPLIAISKNQGIFIVFLYPIYKYNGIFMFFYVPSILGESAGNFCVFFLDHLKQTSGNTWDLVMNLIKVAYERSHKKWSRLGMLGKRISIWCFV